MHTYSITQLRLLGLLGDNINIQFSRACGMANVSHGNLVAAVEHKAAAAESVRGVRNSAVLWIGEIHDEAVVIISGSSERG